ncbi:MAG: nucleotidyl cyclase domain-containing protein [Candidatus Dormibacteria bacterium]
MAVATEAATRRWWPLRPRSSGLGGAPTASSASGGDEFALLLPGADGAAGGRILEQATARLGRSAPGARFSAGGALAPEDGATADILFGTVDIRLYQHKRHREQRRSRARAHLGVAWALEFSETSSGTDAP